MSGTAVLQYVYAAQPLLYEPVVHGLTACAFEVRCAWHQPATAITTHPLQPASPIAALSVHTVTPSLGRRLATRPLARTIARSAPLGSCVRTRSCARCSICRPVTAASLGRPRAFEWAALRRPRAHSTPCALRAAAAVEAAAAEAEDRLPVARPRLLTLGCLMASFGGG